MSVKRVLAILLCIGMLPAMSACSFRIQSVDSLMRAPKLTGVNQLTEQTLEKSVGGDIILKIPLTGRYASAFVYNDLDGDGTEECVAFYASKTDSDAVHMNLLAQDNGQWYSVCDAVGSGSDVGAVAFADVDGDGVSEIIVTWSIAESKESRFLTLYGKYNKNDGVVALMNEKFTATHTLDVNRDGKDEIFIASLETVNNAYVAYGKLFAYNDGTGAIELVSVANLDPAVTSYLQIVDDTDGGICRLYIDGVVSQTHISTQIVEIPADSMILRLPLPEDREFSNLTLRTGRLCCADIDNDGRIEVPGYEELSAGEVLDRDNGVAEGLRMTVWKQYRGGMLTAVRRYIESPDGDYSFTLPADVIGTVTAVYDVKNGRLRFYTLSPDHQKNHMLFYIEKGVFVADEEETALTGGIIYRDESSIYSAVLTALGSAAGVELDRIRACFDKA